MFYLVDDTAPRPPWNKGKLIGQKKPLKLKEIWTCRFASKTDPGFALNIDPP
jgi:hypothetical protein